MMGGWLFMLVLPIVVVALPVWALSTRWGSFWAHGDQVSEERPALQILKERFARRDRPASHSSSGGTSSSALNQWVAAEPGWGGEATRPPKTMGQRRLPGGARPWAASP